jgi:hypothetical protein
MAIKTNDLDLSDLLVDVEKENSNFLISKGIGFGMTQKYVS